MSTAEVIGDIFAFWAKVGGLAVVFHYAATRFFVDSLPPWLVVNALPVSAVSALVLVFFDRLTIYPRFRSPMRHLPVVKSLTLPIIVERPRGKSPLAFFQRYPEADMVVMRDPALLNFQRLFPASPEALRDILNTNTYDWEKPWGVRAFLARIIGFGLILSEGDAHRKQRKTLTPAFNIRNIRALYSLMWEKTNILMDQLELEQKSQGYSDICPWASRLTLDVIGPSALSRDFDSLHAADNPIADAFSEILDPAPSLVAFLALNFFVPQWIATRLPMRANDIIGRQCTFLRNMCRKILQEKHAVLYDVEKKSQKSEEDILQRIIESGDFTDEEIVDQMLTFLAAGHETTASALSWCMYLLCIHPETQKRLREEIRRAIPSAESQVTYSLLESMPVLNGVCEEVFRLFPTVPATIRESVRDTVVAGVTIPRGTFAIIAPYAINRHPASWGANAGEFVPDRWIDTLEDGTQRPNKNGGARSNFCEATFLHGPRACIGRDFAKAELRCAVAGIIGRFNVEMQDPNQEIIIAGTVTTKPAGGLPLKMTRIGNW